MRQASAGSFFTYMQDSSTLWQQWREVHVTRHRFSGQQPQTKEQKEVKPLRAILCYQTLPHIF